MILPAEEHRNGWNSGWLHSFTYGLLILAPTCNGFSAGFLWVCQGKYINDCASEKNKGLYNSIFLLCTFGFAFIFGNLMSTELIKYYSETVLFIVLASLSACTTVYLCFLKMPRPPLLEDESKEPFVEEADATFDLSQHDEVNRSTVVRSTLLESRPTAVIEEKEVTIR